MSDWFVAIIKKQLIPLGIFKNLTTMSEGNSKNVHIPLNFIFIFYFTTTALGHIYNFKFTESLKPVLGKKIIFLFHNVNFYFFVSLFYILIVQSSIHAYFPQIILKWHQENKGQQIEKREVKKTKMECRKFLREKERREPHTLKYTFIHMHVHTHTHHNYYF